MRVKRHYERFLKWMIYYNLFLKEIKGEMALWAGCSRCNSMYSKKGEVIDMCSPHPCSYLGRQWLSVTVHSADELYCGVQRQHLSLVCGPRTLTIDGTSACKGNNKVVSHATRRSSLKLKLKENSQHYSISCYVKPSTSLAPLNVKSMQMRLLGWHERCMWVSSVCRRKGECRNN